MGSERPRTWAPDGTLREEDGCLWVDDEHRQRVQVPGLRIPPAWGCRPFGQPEVIPAHTCILIFARKTALVNNKSCRLVSPHLGAGEAAEKKPRFGHDNRMHRIILKILLILSDVPLRSLRRLRLIPPEGEGIQTWRRGWRAPAACRASNESDQSPFR